MNNKKIIIAGGTGFIGQALAARWGRDNRVIILSRGRTGWTNNLSRGRTGSTNNLSRGRTGSTNNLSQGRTGAPNNLGRTGSPNNSYGNRLLTAKDGYRITYWHWDGRTVERHWAEELEGCDLVVNLAGRSVNCRYTARNRREIFDSRTNATQAIGKAIAASVVPPKLWINASSATIYRHATDRPQDEYTGETGEGFSVDVCRKWESVFFSQRTPFTRKIAARTAITLGHGGVIVPYLRMLRCGLGGRQGSGRQMFSWVHIDDVGRAIEWLLDRSDLEGVFNVAAPGPVSNECFMAKLRRLAHVRIGVSIPEWLLRCGAWLVGTETELLLKSRWVVPTRLQETGFSFRYPRLDTALEEILHREGKAISTDQQYQKI